MHSMILDMDPGVDDALALLWALSSADVAVEAVTTVSGNVNVDLATTNALKLAELMDRSDVPVFRGASEPVVGDAIRATHIHGETGLGAAQLPHPQLAASEGNATTALCALLRSRPGHFQIVAVGPLTNLALAEQREPGILSLAQEVVIMGGALRVPGNVTPTGEFNFVSDPQAARTVITSSAEIRLVPLDATRQMHLSKEQLLSQLQDATPRLREVCLQLTATAMEIGQKKSGVARMYLHDPLTTLLAIQPELAGWETLNLDVEPIGELTAGHVVVDERSQSDLQGKPVSVATRVHRDKVLDEFFKPFLTMEMCSR
jgi:purine nucleosidase